MCLELKGSTSLLQVISINLDGVASMDVEASLPRLRTPAVIGADSHIAAGKACMAATAVGPCLDSNFGNYQLAVDTAASGYCR